MKKLLIYGVAYPEIVKLIDSINQNKKEWEILGYIDDNESYYDRVFSGIKVLGSREILEKYANQKNIYVFNNYYFGLNSFKERIKIINSYGLEIPSLIHPSTNLDYVKIGKGCLISEGCTIGVNVEMGDYVTLRLRSLINHDAKIENYVHVGPGSIVGSCSILKEGCFLGAGANIIRTKTVGAASIVGAGAMVVKDVAPYITVAGIPAKKLKKGLIKKIKNKIKKILKESNLFTKRSFSK